MANNFLTKESFSLHTVMEYQGQCLKKITKKISATRNHDLVTRRTKASIGFAGASKPGFHEAKRTQ